MEVAVAERNRVAQDLGDEGVRPGVVGAGLARRQRAAFQQIEDGFARERELSSEERRVERRVDARIGKTRDRRAGVDRSRDPGAALGRARGAARREVFRPQVLHDLPARFVVADDRGDANRFADVPVRREPAAPGAVLIGRVDDPDRGSAVGERDAKVAAPPHVPGQGLDAERRQVVPARELG